MDPLDPSCPMDVHWTWCPSVKLSNGVQWIRWIHFRCSMDMSNGSIWVDPIDTIAKPSLASEHHFGVFVQWAHCVQWIHCTKTPNWFSLAKLGLVSVSIGSTQMDPLDIHWTCPLKIGNGSIEHHWKKTLPMDIMSIGHDGSTERMQKTVDTHEMVIFCQITPDLGSYFSFALDW